MVNHVVILTSVKMEMVVVSTPTVETQMAVIGVNVYLVINHQL